MEKRLTVRLPEGVYDKVRVTAAFQGSGMAEWTRDLIRDAVCEHEKAFEGVCGDCGHVE